MTGPGQVFHPVVGPRRREYPDGGYGALRSRAIAELPTMSSALAVGRGGPESLIESAVREQRPAGSIRGLVADDDALARRMVCDRLGTADVQIVGEARDGDEAVAMTLDLAPDIVVMD